MSSPRKISRPLTCAIGAIGALLAAIAFQLAHEPNIDDSFILDVYIRHLSETGSIFWNAQEGHVDGCTSILDLIVKTLIYRVFGGDIAQLNWALVFVLMLLGTAAGTWMTVRFVERFASHLDIGVVATALVGALALATNRAATDGAKMLLEPPLFLLTLFIALALQLLPSEFTRRKLAVLGASWVCVALARPEGLALVVLFAAFFLWRERGRLEPRDRALPVAIAAACLGAYFIWHTIYFGYWAPNTYYAKKSDSRWFEVRDGYAYVIFFMRTGAWARMAIGAVLLAPLLWLVPGWRDDEARHCFGFLSVTAVVNLATIVYAGGDCYWGYGRFLATCTTLTMLAFVVAGAGLQGISRFVGVASLGCLLTTSLYAMSETAGGGRGAYSLTFSAVRPPAVNCQEDAATSIESTGLKRVAETDLQSLKYFHDDIEVIDASGLNDKIAAHLPAPGRVLLGKGGISYAIDRNAELLVLGPWIFTPTPMAEYPADELARDNTMSWHFMSLTIEPENWRRLAATYRSMSLSACGKYVNLWVREDLVARLAGRPGVLIGPPRLAVDLPLDREDGSMRGFWPPQRKGDGVWRWTKGDAEVTLDAMPLSPDDRPCALVVSAGPDSQAFQMAIDGKSLEREANDISRWRVPSGALDPGRTHTLGIASSTTTRDDRDVGVMLTGLQVDCAAPRPAP